MTSRGIRLNNPTNIRRNDSTEKFQGVSAEQNDPNFLEFTSAEYGIRAAALNLIHYYDFENVNTIAEIIAKWAPSNENNTQAYIDSVAKYTGFNKDKQLDLHLYACIFPLVKAIINQENGSQPYDDATINAGLLRAGIQIPKKPLMATTVIKGAVTAVAGQAAGIGGTLVENTPTLAQYADSSHYLHAACGVLTALGIGLTIYGKATEHVTEVT